MLEAPVDGAPRDHSRQIGERTGEWTGGEDVTFRVEGLDEPPLLGGTLCRAVPPRS